MKMIIAGPRTLVPTTSHVKILDEHKHLISEVVTGGAKGADAFGESWAQWNNIPVTKFLAEWDKYERFAGPIRNTQMAEYAEGLIAFWDGISPGTKNMIKQAKEYNLWTKVCMLDDI